MSDTTNPKDRLGSQKPSLRHVPPVAMYCMGQVMDLGAEKYGAFNWRTVDVRSSIYYDAILRHLHAWHDGQTNDPESGVSHLAHIMASCAIMLDAGSLGKLIDDRPENAGPTADWLHENTRKTGARSFGGSALEPDHPLGWKPSASGRMMPPKPAAPPPPAGCSVGPMQNADETRFKVGDRVRSKPGTFSPVPGRVTFRVDWSAGKYIRLTGGHGSTRYCADLFELAPANGDPA